VSTETALTLVFSGLVAASTIVYACLTGSLVAETRRLRRIQTDAKLGISVVESQWAFGFVDLFIRNFGGGAALDVRFEIVETEREKGDTDILNALRSLGLIQKGMDYWPPGHEYRSFLVNIIGGNRPEMPDTYVHLRVTYASASGEKHADCYPIDLAHLWNRTRLGNPHFETMARELELIRKALEKLEMK
jgi:hypothetical protein